MTLALGSLSCSANQAQNPAVFQALRSKSHGRLANSVAFFFPSGALEGWRLQCRFFFILMVRAKRLNIPFVKPQGSRSYRDVSSSMLLWQVNQNTLMFHCFPIFYIRGWLHWCFRSHLLAVKSPFQFFPIKMNSRTQRYKAFPAVYVSILNTFFFRILNLFFAFPFLLTSKPLKILSGEDFFPYYLLYFTSVHDISNFILPKSLCFGQLIVMQQLPCACCELLSPVCVPLLLQLCDAPWLLAGNIM